jgi:hypothetical protein
VWESSEVAAVRFASGIVLALSGLLLVGCVSADEQRAQDMSADQQRCAASGFQPGTSAMAECMDTAAASRAADKDRDAFNRAQRDQLQAQRDADERARDDAQAQKNRDDFQRDFQRLQAGGSIVPDDRDDDTNRPTAAQIPGMVCDGTGDDATCDAR